MLRRVRHRLSLRYNYLFLTMFYFKLRIFTNHAQHSSSAWQGVGGIFWNGLPEAKVINFVKKYVKFVAG